MEYIEKIVAECLLKIKQGYISATGFDPENSDKLNKMHLTSKYFQFMKWETLRDVPIEKRFLAHHPFLDTQRSVRAYSKNVVKKQRNKANR